MAMDLYSLAFRMYGLQHPWTDLWISFKLLLLLASVSIHHNKLNTSFQRYINLVVPSIPDGSSRFRLLKGFVISPLHLVFLHPMSPKRPLRNAKNKSSSKSHHPVHPRCYPYLPISSAFPSKNLLWLHDQRHQPPSPRQVRH